MVQTSVNMHNEPLADDDWIARYNERLRKTHELELELENQLNGTSTAGEW